MSNPFTFVMAGTAFGWCLMSAILGRPASPLYFVLCLTCALVGLAVEHRVNRAR